MIILLLLLINISSFYQYLVSTLNDWTFVCEGVCVCACVCVRVCVCVCVYVRVYTNRLCACVSMYVLEYLCKYVYISKMVQLHITDFNIFC